MFRSVDRIFHLVIKCKNMHGNLTPKQPAMKQNIKINRPALIVRLLISAFTSYQYTV